MIPYKGYLREIRFQRERVANFGVYPFSMPLLRDFDVLSLNPGMTIFVGENGSGKSSLLEAIAVAAGMNAEGGSQNARFETRNTHSELHEYLKLVRGVRRPRDSYFLRAEAHYALSSYIDDLDDLSGDPKQRFRPYGGESLHQMSHGESFWAVLEHRFGKEGLYLLDEPESALSPTRQLAALGRMHALAAAGAQFIVATHSPILMAFPEATIYHFGDGPLRQVAYEDTEHHQVYSDFFHRREAMLKALLGDS